MAHHGAQDRLGREAGMSIRSKEDSQRVETIHRRVERALAIRYPGARIVWRRGPDAAPASVRTFLEVHAPGGGYTEVFPVAVVDGDVGRPVLDGYVEHVVNRYRLDMPFIKATLVHTGVVSA